MTRPMKIALLPGDGIGQEVMPVALDVSSSTRTRLVRNGRLHAFSSKVK